MTTYYVRKDGNNSNNGLTDSAGGAKLTIAAAYALTAAGDTVIVHTGTYAENLTQNRAGSAGNLITIQAYTGETVSINKSILSANYNVLDGFRVTAPGRYADGSAGAYVSGNNCRVLRNTYVSTGTAGETGPCAMLSDGDDNIFSYNTVDGQNRGTNNGFAHIFYGEEGSNRAEVSYNTAKNIYNLGRGFEPYGFSHVFHHNECYGCSGTGAGTHVDMIQTYGVSGRQPGRYMLWYSNFFHDNSTQWVMCADNPQQGGTEGVISHWVFINNIWANITNEGGFIKSTYFIFHNNTWYNVGQGPGYNFLLMTTDAEGWGYGGRFVNNLIATNTNQGVDMETPRTFDKNYWGNQSFGTYNSGLGTEKLGTNYINAGNPQFTSVAGLDFHIGSTSVCRGVGTNLASWYAENVGTWPQLSNAAVLKDYDGNTRGATWDIGAVGYNLSGATPPTGTITLSVR